MLRILLFIFVALPLLELYVLIEVGSGIGGLATIALCLLTAAAGGLIIRWQGLQTLLQARKSMQQLQHHQLAEQGLHGVMLVLAGVLLFFPGLITDSLGFLLLVPAVRQLLIRSKSKPWAAPSNMYDEQGQSRGRKATIHYDDVVDATVIDKD